MTKRFRCSAKERRRRGGSKSSTTLLSNKSMAQYELGQYREAAHLASIVADLDEDDITSVVPPADHDSGGKEKEKDSTNIVRNLRRKNIERVERCENFLRPLMVVEQPVILPEAA
ncbi:unnamed protein product, partial [Amoebophrya sp. A120]|eukprot:GSA120T00013011001.1